MKPTTSKQELLNTIYEIIASVRSNGAYPAETFIADIAEKLIESGKQEEREIVLRVASDCEDWSEEIGRYIDALSFYKELNLKNKT